MSAIVANQALNNYSRLQKFSMQTQRITKKVNKHNEI